MPKELLKLNLGCGKNKIPGYVNIDGEASCKPDRVLNILEKLPYKDNSVSEIVMFHCIEHINKRLHSNLLLEFWRVLCPEGGLTFSYPEFSKIIENWKTNFRGQKEFWEATIYGRQAYPGDFHVCVMHTPDFRRFLGTHGFVDVISCPESGETHNTIISCQKGMRIKSYEDLVKEDMLSHKLKKVRV